MKRTLILILTIALIFVIAVGCAEKPKEPTPSPNGEGNEETNGEAKYKDGTYTAKGDEDSNGWTPEVTITVKEGKIESAEFNEFSSENDVYKTEDEEYKENFKKNSSTDLESVYEKFGTELVNKQDPEKVDAKGGATQSGENFIELSKKALEQAKEK